MVLEKDLERKCVQLARAFGCRLYKFVSPGVAGMPDRALLIPGGRLHFIEFKRPDGTGRLSEVQKERIKELQALGFRVDVVSSRETFYQILSSYHENNGHQTGVDAEALSTAAYHTTVRK